jgi:ATP-dependent Clp protease, protease subunit
MYQKKWYNIIDNKNNIGEISIFGEIGGWGITLDQFVKDFDLVKDKSEIKVYVNSPGGDVFAGVAIYNILSKYRDKVTVEVLGLVASIASVVALAGSKLIMYDGAMMMLHNPLMFTAGNSEQLRKDADTLDKIKEQIINIYLNNTNYSEKEIDEIMNDETWLTADDVVKHFNNAEKIEVKAAACAFSLVDKFKKVPKNLIREQIKVDNITIRDFEVILRDVGFSQQDSKMLASVGFPKDLKPCDEEKSDKEVEIALCNLLLSI